MLNVGRLIATHWPTEKLEILRFEDLYFSSIIEFMHSYMYGKLPNSFDGTWILNRLRNPNMVELRTANELFVPKFRILFSARLPLHTFPKVWNEFSNAKLKNTPNVKTFKEYLKIS